MPSSSRSRSHMQRVVAMLLAAVLILAGVAATEEQSPSSSAGSSNASSTPRASRGFLDCLAPAGSEDAVEKSLVGRALGCARIPVVQGLRSVRESAGRDLPLWDGVVLHRVSEVPDVPDVDPATDASGRARSLDPDRDDVAAYHDVISELDRVSRSYAMDVDVYPGVRAVLKRDERSDDAVNLSFKLDGLTEAQPEDDDEESVDVEGAEKGRDISDYLMAEDRHGHKKKKGLKKLKKKLKKYLPLLAIPLAIQMLLLPLYILALKMMALKSILLGKMTLMLVAFNILRNVHQRQVEDSHNSRVAAEYYGYHDDGVEYGGWVNRRRSFGARSARSQGRGSGSRRR